MKLASFVDIKDRLLLVQNKDKALREQVRTAVARHFKTEVIKEMSFTKDSIILVAINKISAQELFFRKNLIEKELKKNILIK